MYVYFDGKAATGIVLFQCIRDGGGSLRLSQMIVVMLRGGPLCSPSLTQPKRASLNLSCAVVRCLPWLLRGSLELALHCDNPFIHL